MAQWIRSVKSAAHHQETLFMVAARDSFQNVESRDLRAARDELLKYPNMNSTGRLPAVGLFHVGMNVRFTVTVCPCQAPVDTVGVIQHIELHNVDRLRWLQHQSDAIFLLHHMPTILVKIEDDETDTGLGPGIVAVEATTSLPFSLTLQVPIRIGRQDAKRDIDVRARRQQVPLTIANASTLYTLQGTTADPGLIYHWKSPRPGH